MFNITSIIKRKRHRPIDISMLVFDYISVIDFAITVRTKSMYFTEPFDQIDFAKYFAFSTLQTQSIAIIFRLKKSLQVL